jgi:UDP-N-acetylglucosamine/UDP-N-acetylgalactosamine diphosphorylase
MAPNVHIRQGCLLEEEVVLGHTVGLKQTVLLSFVTLGSMINFCDLLMAGGRSRRDHSEVGSGFIHFNYTPYGSQGDKATASLIGDVVEGVLLDQPRIFLGGAGGAVGPLNIGFGSVTGAGQVLREDVPAGTLVLGITPERRKLFSGTLSSRRVSDIARRNATYIGQLNALRVWYQMVRRPRAGDQPSQILVDEAIRTMDSCIGERVRQLRAFLHQHGSLNLMTHEDVPLPSSPPGFPLDLSQGRAEGHLSWVQSLADEEKAIVKKWLRLVASMTEKSFVPSIEGV